MKILETGALDDVGVRLEVYVGETEISLGELEGIDEGEVLQLNTSIDQPVEIRVRGVLVGRGELVSVGDSFGIKIVEIASMR